MCIEEVFINSGIWCFGVGTGLGNTATETYNYWLPADTNLSGSYNIMDASND